MKTSKLTATIIEEIKALGNPVRALADQRYHKSRRVHWGVTAPICNSFIKSFSKNVHEHELIQIANELWHTNHFDHMICAARILCLPRIKPSSSVWNLLQDFLKDVDGWALEDTLSHVAWKCILDNPELLEELENWTTHPNFWMRRATLVYTLPYAKRGRNPERMLEWASLYSTESEWFIQKAIGWWLRVLGEHNPERVLAFLETHWKKLKPVARKESTRKLSKDLQEKVKLY